MRFFDKILTDHRRFVADKIIALMQAVEGYELFDGMRGQKNV